MSKKRKSGGWDNYQKRVKKLLREDAQTCTAITTFFVKKNSCTDPSAAAASTHLASSGELPAASTHLASSGELSYTPVAFPITTVPTQIITPKVTLPASTCTTSITSSNSSHTHDCPFQPEQFPFPKKTTGKLTRSFQASWFKVFPFLDYQIEGDCVHCFICKKQNAMSTLERAKNKDRAFISTGFSNWKKALKRFKEHQNSECHRIAVDLELQSRGITIQERLDNECKSTMATNRHCLIKIIETLQYLSQQGIALQGNTDEQSNFVTLLRLRSKDDPILSEWIERAGDKYLSHDIQNEICRIMAHSIVNQIVSDMGYSFFSLIADEYTDISNNEQLTICVRWIDEQLEAHEDLLGFYNIPNIKSATIVSVIKDALIRVQLSLANCRGQCYDGASNMLGHVSGVAKTLQADQPKALITHCQAHSLSLSVKSVTGQCKILADTMSTTKEIATLIKYSPKRENMLGELKKNIEEDSSNRGILKLSFTRWTVRAECFKRVLENYDPLTIAWEEFLDGKNIDPDVRGRIIGCQAQMTTFQYFFGLHLGHLLFSHTDNVSKTLQGSKMSSTDGKQMANMTIQVLAKLRTDESFTLFYSTVLIKSHKHESVGEPCLPRQRRAPKRYEVGSGQGTFPDTVEEYYRRIYFEAIDSLMASIESYFDQPSFNEYATLESILLKSTKSESTDVEIQKIAATYSDDINFDRLVPQLGLFGIMMENSDAQRFHDILTAVIKLSPEEKKMIPEVITLCKLIMVNPATSATGERTFSLARRLKTWLRTNMSQERFNSLAIIHWHKDRTTKLCVKSIAERFVNDNDHRRKIFGYFD